MGWDGNGAFTRTKDWTSDRDASTKILASRHDENDDELTAGIAATLTKNGETKPTADFRPNADASYSLGSTALRWVNAWISGVIKFKQASFAGTLTQQTLTADRTYTLPDVSGELVSSGAPITALPNGTNDWVFLSNAAGGGAGIRTLISVLGALPQFHTTASDTAKGEVELATALETLNGADATIAMTPAGFASNISISGNKIVIRLPGNIWINAGQTNYSDPNTSDTFLVAFPNNMFSIVSGYISGNANHNGVRWTSVSKTGFTAVVNPGAGGSAIIYWIAVGN